MEDDEGFQLLIDSLPNRFTHGSNVPAIVTIQDNDSKLKTVKQNICSKQICNFADITVSIKVT